MNEPSRARLVLKPLRPTEPDRRAASARSAAAAALGRNLRTGDLVTADGDSYVVRRTEPGGALDVDATTPLDFDFLPDPPRRALADAVVLLDTSWSMRRQDLAPTRLEAVKRALATLLHNATDVVHRAAVVGFGAAPAVVAPFAAPSSLDLPAVEALAPRGPGRVEPALDLALEILARDGDAVDEPVVLLATDSDPNAKRTLECAARASRLDVAVHVLDAGCGRPEPLERLAEETGGTYHRAHDGVTFRPALQALAQRFGVPLQWRDPARAVGETEFEVVLSAMTEREVDEFPALPRRVRRK